MNIIDLKELHFKTKEIAKEGSSISEQINSSSILNLFSKIKLIKAKKRLLSELKKETDLLNRELDSFLFREHERFIELNLQNRTLLTENEFKLNIYKNDFSPFISSSEYSFIGKIHPNGYLYLSLEESRSVLTDFGSGLMPKLLSGSYNEYGDFNAETVKRSLNIFMYKIPKFYIAKANNEYHFEMKAGDTEWDVGGKAIVSRMVGDPFNKNETNRAQFLQNRSELKTIRTEFLNSL